MFGTVLAAIGLDRLGYTTLSKGGTKQRVTLTLAVVLAVLSLSSCFLFENHSIAFAAHLWYYDPQLKLEPFCYGADVKATFGVNVLLDVSVDQTDLGSNTMGIEGATSKMQPYYAGMPLIVEVSCRNQLGEEIGQSRYEGRLKTTSDSAHFSLFNYPDPAIDFSTCVPPTASTGTQMCAQAFGFEF